MSVSVCKREIDNKTRAFLSALAIVIFSMISLTGCGNPTGGGTVSQMMRNTPFDCNYLPGCHGNIDIVNIPLPKEYNPNAPGNIELSLLIGGVWTTMNEIGFFIEPVGNMSYILVLDPAKAITAYNLISYPGKPIVGPPGGNNQLVLNAGQAWTNEFRNLGYAWGIIFRSDNTFLEVDKDFGIWTVTDGGTYSVTGSMITFIYNNGDILTESYRITGNTLIFDDFYEFRVTNNVNAGSSGGPTGGNLVLSAGQAWTNLSQSSSYAFGLIFRSNGTFSEIEYALGIWMITDGGTYSVTGNTITYTYNDGYRLSEYYTIIGNSLFLDDGFELRITNSVNPIGLAKSRQANASSDNARAERRSMANPIKN
ncbi:MAG: lipocalin family protein [Chitinispirillia bacterium]|nr:lipocalin family protein [Chitinispirillia bacterium]